MLIYGWFIKADSHTLYYDHGIKYKNIQVHKNLRIINIQDMEIGKRYLAGERYFSHFMTIKNIHWQIFKP